MEKKKIGKALDGKPDGLWLGRIGKRSLEDSISMLPDARMSATMGVMVGVRVVFWSQHPNRNETGLGILSSRATKIAYASSRSNKAQ